MGTQRRYYDGTVVLAAFLFLAAGKLCPCEIAGAVGNVYQDDRIQVVVPNGWSAKRVTVTTSGDETIEIPIGVSLSKGLFRLYLLTHYGQVTG